MRHARPLLLHAVAIASPWLSLCCVTSFVDPSWLVSQVGHYLPEPVEIQAFDCMGGPVGTADEKALYLLHKIGEALLASSVYGLPLVALLVVVVLLPAAPRSTRVAWRVAMTSLVSSHVALQSVLHFAVWAMQS